MTLDSAHKEKAFENDIVQGFVDQKWLSSPNDKGYDPYKALYVPDVLAWLKSAYAEQYAKFSKRSDADEFLLNVIEEALKEKGTLYVLRNSLTAIGFGTFRMSEIKPEDNRNPIVAKRYKANILRVVQQVHFRTDSKESIDLVFFVNGIPVATAEVKTNFTQDVNEAVIEYKKNRKPKPTKTSAECPLLKPERGAVVHFAISETDIQMTTKLDGEGTRFLPFNKGNNGHAGNPEATKTNPYPVSYFWKEIGKKDAWLGLFHNFAYVERTVVTNAKGYSVEKSTLIFPRYHQWRAVTKVIADAKKRGVGQKYLIEHSAGSGKTKTITWTASQLSKLRDENGNAYFDTILIMSDRKVLDSQLSKAVLQFNTKEGLVKSITAKDGSKTESLVKALVDGKRIVIVTIQTFPFAMEEIILNEKLQGKRFAVIFDEAHNSQTGRSSARLNTALGNVGTGSQEAQTVDDLLEAWQKSRLRPANVSFLGFTATPKHQTMMLFGRLKNGDAYDIAKADSNKELPVSFDKYPMRQAIEEGFILDVLQGFTPYSTAWKLSQKTETDKDSESRVDVKAAMSGLAKWKALHPTNVTQKTEFIIEHFKRNVASLLNGQAKAMIVTSSRASVVRYKKAFEQYIANHKDEDNIPILRLGIPLAAFSGEVVGKDAKHPADVVQDDSTAWVNLIKADEKYTEQSLNPSVSFGQDGALEKAFDGDNYRLMIVANKFQTGFDQPKLCAMYVDKVIGNPVEIVQTYSRLNRIYPGKDRTFIVDFVNDKDSVINAFKLYDSGASINEAQDVQVLDKIRRAILDVGIFSEEDVQTFTEDYFTPMLHRFAQGAKDDPTAHQQLNVFFSEPAKIYEDRLHSAYDLCKQYEEEHRNAVLCKDEDRAAQADNNLKEASKAYESVKRFKSNLSRFGSAYNYIAQITDINSGELEGFAHYCAFLVKLLSGIKPEDIDLSSVILTHYELKADPTSPPGGGDKNPEDEEDVTLKPITGGGSNEAKGKLPEYLADILDAISNFAGDLASTQDALNYCTSVADKVGANDIVREQARNNSRDVAKSGAMNEAVMNAVFELLEQNQKLTTMVASDAAKKDELMNIVYAMLKTEHRIQPKEVELYDHRLN